MVVAYLPFKLTEIEHFIIDFKEELEKEKKIEVPDQNP
jgi:hypothetical protein